MKTKNIPNIRIIYRGQSGQKDIFDSRKNEKNQTKEREKYHFESKIDTRDEIIQVEFKVNSLDSSDLYHMSGQLIEWMAMMIENILSVTFRYILEEKLTMLEGKAFASKNILLNLKQTCQFIGHQLKIPIDEDFLHFIDNTLFEIISEVMNKYPQTNTKGASHRLKAFIKPISNKENDQYDFLLNNEISISYSPNGDYSSDIMNVINKILQLPQEQATKDSFIQEFHIFCNELFYHASKKGKGSQISSGDSFEEVEHPVKLNKVQESNLRNSLEGTKNVNNQLGTFQNKYKQERVKVEASLNQAEEIIFSEGEVTEDLLKFEETKGHMFASCQKIPSEAKLFTSKEIRSGQFRVYHASILRVMTKWAQELHNKIKEASERIRHRVHKFKTSKNKLRFCQVEEKEFLYEAAVCEKEKIDEYLKDLKKENSRLQAIFSTEAFQGVYSKKFTNVGIFAGRLEEILGQLTFKYLNRLIHSLLTITQAASQNISEHYKIYEENEIQAEKKRLSLKQINLVSLKVGDLIRGRYICLQHQFFNILALLYKIEEVDSKFLKIVKIKNRLSDKNNDILINLFFKNKILCELQLAIFKEENKKQKIYSQFNHFLYELKRSQFGVLSALSNTVAQYDPVVSYFAFNKNKQPKVTKTSRSTNIGTKNPETIVLKRGQSVSNQTVISPAMIEKGIQKPFICSRCKNLRIVHNVKFYYRTLLFQQFCNECIESYLLQFPQSCKDIIQDLFRYYVVDEKIQDFVKEIQVWNFKQALKRVKDQKELYASFLQYGFVIQKGQKLPKVHFFRKIYNQMNNNLILSTISGGQIINFLNLNCKQEKNKYLFYNELNKFIFFDIKNCSTSTQIFTTIVMKDHILEESQENDMLELLIVNEQEVLKKDYLKYIQRSFEKYHPTLYLNNYKFVLNYLNEYVSDQDQRVQKHKEYFFKMNALHIINLQLQSSQIKVLHPVLNHFANLREINLSNNYICDLRPLSQLQNLVKINISQNRINTIEPITSIKSLACLIASHNSISCLEKINQLQNLETLDFSYNTLHDISPVQFLLNLLELDLSSNYIENSEGLYKLSKLQKLFIRDNQIEQLDKIGKFSNLSELNFSDNRLKKMPSLDESLQKLEKLNLEDNQIGFITLISIDTLKELDLSNNNITKIQNLSKLVSLEVLDLSSNFIVKIQGLNELRNLKNLNLSINKITEIQNLEDNKNLEQLKLTQNPLQEISNINCLKALVKLEINYCDIQMINQLRKLKKLEILNLSHNKLTLIDRIDELVRIKKLDLSHNNIRKIQNLDSLKYLQNLSLMNNRITKIQNLDLLYEVKWIILSNNFISKLQNLGELESLNILQVQNNLVSQIQNLQQLKELSELWLSFNQIKVISNLQSLTQLKKLGLAHNKIEKIEGLQALTNLEFLDLQANCITKLENLDTLTQLKWLVVSLNKITRIEGIDKLQRLETLIADHNQIEVLENFNKSKRITSLHLNYNRIKKIDGLFNLTNLQKLYLGGNHITKMDNLQSLGHLNELSLCDNKISKMQNLKSLLHLKSLNLANNKITVIQDIENLCCLKKMDLSGNQIQVFDHFSIMDFINEINIVNNPLKDVSQDMEVHSNIKFYLNTLMQRFDSVAAHKSQEKRKHKVFRSLNLSQTSRKNLQEEDLQDQRADLIRTFTKTIITQL